MKKNPANMDDQEKSIRMMSRDFQKGIEDPSSKEGGIIKDHTRNVDQEYFDQQQNYDNEMNRFQRILGGVPRR